MKLNNILVVALSSLLLFSSVNAAEKPSKKKKQTTLNLYLTAKEAHDKISKNKDKVLFVDIRTRAEVNFLGMPTLADANIPYMKMNEWYAWDKKKHNFKLDPNNEFANSIAEKLKAKGLNKESEIILMCRSGSRSAKAVDLLAKSGYKKVYTVVDGYEGGKAKSGPTKGQRTVNGWKNSKLPWTYKLDKSKMYQSASK